MAKEQRRCKTCGRFMRKMWGITYYFNPNCSRCADDRSDYALVP